MRLGRGAAAVKVLWQGIASDPGRVENRNILATPLIRLDRIAEAEALYRETMRLFPTDDVSRNALAKLLADKGRIAEAEALYRETMAGFPQDTYFRQGLGLLLLEYRPDADGVREVETLLSDLRAIKPKEAGTLQHHLARHRRGEPFQRGLGGHAAAGEEGALAAGKLPSGLLVAADIRRAEFLLGGALDRDDLLLTTPEERARLRQEAIKTLTELLAGDPTNPALLLIARRYRDKFPALDVADEEIIALAEGSPVLAIAARRFGLVARDYTSFRQRWPDLAPLADWAALLDQTDSSNAAARNLVGWIRAGDPKKMIPALARLHGEVLRLTKCPAPAIDDAVLTRLVTDNPEGLDDLLDICLLATIEVRPERRLLLLQAA
jgi:tetratricopeptide (TPR) repeat protein